MHYIKISIFRSIKPLIQRHGYNSWKLLTTKSWTWALYERISQS